MSEKKLSETEVLSVIGRMANVSPTMPWGTDDLTFSSATQCKRFFKLGGFDIDDYYIEEYDSRQSRSTGRRLKGGVFKCYTWINQDKTCTFSCERHPLGQQGHPYVGKTGCTGNLRIAAKLRKFVLDHCDITDDELSIESRDFI